MVNEVDLKKRYKRFYIKSYYEITQKLGAGPSILYGFLEFLSKKFDKDDYGYFRVFNTFIRENLGIGPDRLKRDRDTLVRAGYIDYIQGVNQNAKPRYKIVL